MPSTRTFTALRNGATEARLELSRGGTHITIRAAEIDELCRAEFTGVTPKATANGGIVKFDYARYSAAELLRHPAHRAEIELTPALPWSLAFNGGLGRSTADLRGLELQGLEIAAGAGDLRVVLPAPQGVVPVRFGGGISKVTIDHPAGTAIGLRIAGGASRLAFDGQRYGALGGETRLESTGARDAADRYEIEVGGGASELTVEELEAGEAR